MQVVIPTSVLLKGNSSVDIDIKYRPLNVGEASASLKMECPELGLYEYGLRLAGLPTNSERSMTFNAPLGSREAQVFR